MKKKKFRLKLPLSQRADRKVSQKEREAKNNEASGAENQLDRHWVLEALQDCFCFSIKDKEIYVEFAELLASGDAYKAREPQSLWDLLERLENAEPGFEGINILETDIYLDRKRIEGGKGLLQRFGERKIRFLSDPTLKTINFYDFYFDHLRAGKEEEKADNIYRLPPKLKEG